MKKIYSLIAAVSISTLSFAQDAAPNNKVFHSLGYAVYTEVAAGPVKVDSWIDQYGPHTEVAQDAGFSYFSMFYRFRYNVHEMNDNSAIGLSVTPDLGLAITAYGAGYFNLPVMAEIEFGAGATYNSTAEKGGLFGFGFEMNKLSLINFNNIGSSGSTEHIVQPRNFWVQPVLTTGIRYWNKKNKMKEVNLKFGFGAKNDVLPATYETNGGFRFPPITLRLSFVTFLNY